MRSLQIVDDSGKTCAMLEKSAVQEAGYDVIQVLDRRNMPACRLGVDPNGNGYIQVSPPVRLLPVERSKR